MTEDVMSTNCSSRREQRARPGLYRIATSASVYLFLCFLSFAMCFTPLAELFLERSCEQNGLDKAHCKSEIDGRKNSKYDDAQQRAAAASVTYTLLIGFPAVVTCAFFGCLGDAFGRRLPLVIPCVGSAMQAVVFAITNSSSVAALACTPLAFGGSVYVNNLAAFSTLADVTRHATPRERAIVFGVVEGFLWVGLLIGPVVGGEMVRMFGSQHAFFAAAAVGIINAVLTLLTYPETLAKHRRCMFSWRRANPFASLLLFFETRVTFLLSVVLLLCNTAQTGGVAMLSLYALKVADLQPTVLGLLQSTVLGASVFGLMIAFPICVRFLSLPILVGLSCFDGALCWALMSLANVEWQLFAVAAGLCLAAFYFPIVRCGMTNTFGKQRYGESLAAVGVVEQICAMIGAPIINGIYQRTENIGFGFGGMTVRSIACLCVAGMYLIGMLAGIFIPSIPKEADDDRLPTDDSLVSDCQQRNVSDPLHA